MKSIDLRKVSITDHARERWVERTGREPSELRPAFLRSRHPGRRFRRRARVWMAGMQEDIANRVTGTLRIDRETGAAFLLRPKGPTSWWMTLVTVFRIADIDAAFGLVPEEEVLAEAGAAQ